MDIVNFTDEESMGMLSAGINLDLNRVFIYTYDPVHLSREAAIELRDLLNYYLEETKDDIDTTERPETEWQKYCWGLLE